MTELLVVLATWVLRERPRRAKKWHLGAIHWESSGQSRGLHGTSLEGSPGGGQGPCGYSQRRRVPQVHQGCLEILEVPKT